MALTFNRSTLQLWHQLDWLSSHVQHVTVWQARDCPRSPDFEGHMHSIPTVLACLQGQVRIFGGRAGRLDLQQGDALILVPGAWHGHDTIRPDCTLFGQGFVGGFSDISMETSSMKLRDFIPEYPSKALVDAITASSDKSHRCALLQELVNNVLDEQSRTGGEEMLPVLEHVLRYIWTNMHRPIEVNDLISISGLSASRLHQLFRDHVGSTPKELLTQERLRLASQLLVEGERVAVVAHRCGFGSRHALIRAFQKKHGCSPREFKKKHGFIAT